jgi:histidyl-tRNA synthetase
VPDGAPLAYAVVPSPAALASALPLLEALRAQGLPVVMHAGGASLKSQLQKADASGARYALIFGDEEVAAGRVKLKPLRERDAAQVDFPLGAQAEVAAAIRGR